MLLQLLLLLLLLQLCCCAVEGRVTCRRVQHSCSDVVRMSSAAAQLGVDSWGSCQKHACCACCRYHDLGRGLGVVGDGCAVPSVLQLHTHSAP